MFPTVDPRSGRSGAQSRQRPAGPGVTAALAVLAALAGLTGVAVAEISATPAGAAGTVDTQLTWSVLSPPESPPPLSYAAAAYDSDNQTVVLFGGVTSSGSLSNDTWVWNGSGWRDYPGSRIEAPSPRKEASMAFDPALHQLILFGGAGSQPFGDTWAWNGASWYDVTPHLTGPSPSPREGAALAYDSQGNLVLFGGDGPAPGAAPSTPGSNSGAPGATTPAAPGARSATTSSSPAPSALDDTWLWTSSGWAQSPAAGPPARTGASMAFDPLHGSLVMFGGQTARLGSPSAELLSDTWTWDGSAWSALTGAPPSQGAPSSVAPARAWAVAAGDTPAGGVVVFGGTGSSGSRSDTWVWDGQAWSPASTDGTPSGRSGAASAYDAAAQQLVVFGGVQEGTTANTGGGPGPGTTIVLTTAAPVGLGPGAVALPAVATTLPGTTQTSSRPGTSVATPTSPGTGSSSRGVTGSARPSTATTAPVDVVRPGSLVTLTGNGFKPGTEVTITFHSTPTIVGRITADAQGGFKVTVAVPQSAKPGTHHFVASGEGPGGPTTGVLASVRVLGAPNPGTSSPTPTEKAVLVMLALLVPLGTWAVLGANSWVRRQRGLA